ncbi:MAG: MFS transporter [Anaerolineales bacterium]|nr:MFS transporter [Anaerolineales bacterium]
MKSSSRYRWVVVVIFFFFILLHQADKLLIGPLANSIIQTFGINLAQFGRVGGLTLLVALIFYIIWGYLYDRFARSKLLSLSSFIWGITTWLGAIAPTFPTFVAARALTGIDDASYPGLYSIISDYFGPRVRGKIYGLLQTAQPIGYIIGMFLGLQLASTVGWRGIFFITGSLGVVMALVIFFSIREPERGMSEPELEDLETIGVYRFDWETAKGLFRKKSLVLLYVQGFFGVFPWNVITLFFFLYLETERNYSPDQVMVSMVIAVLTMAVGYFVGGAIGDYAFKHTPRGRLIVATIGVFLGAMLLLITLNLPEENFSLFTLMLAVTAFFMPFASPNTVSSVYDITLPEVRSTALSLQNFSELAGSWIAPIIAGQIADATSLQTAIPAVSVTAWLLCTAFFIVAAYLIPNDIATLRSQMEERAEADLAAQAA